MDLPVVRYTRPLSDGLARYLMDLPAVRYTRPLSDGFARCSLHSPAIRWTRPLHKNAQQKTQLLNTDAEHRHLTTLNNA